MKLSHLLAATCALLPLGAQVASVATPLPPEAEDRDFDDAAARRKALLWKHAGAPDADYLLFTQKASYQAAGSAGPSGIKGAPGAPAWRPLGPTRLGTGTYSGSPDLDTQTGRVTAIVTHPSSPATLYVAVEGGGVWKSTDADPASAGDWTWTCVTDALPSSSGAGNVSVGDLAMDAQDPQTLYMGMGLPGATLAVGFFTSADGGVSWTQGGSLGGSTGTVRIVPQGYHALVVATDERGGGVYRSTDGGRTFSASVVRPGDRTYNILTMTAFSPQNLAVAGSWYDYGTNAWLPFFSYSTDGGQSWRPSAFPDTFQVPGDPTPRHVDPWAQSLAAGPGGKGYALIGDTADPGLMAHGLLVTADSGATWTFQAAPSLWSAGAGSTFAMMLTADPADASHLFAGTGSASYRSLDGGQTWTQLTSDRAIHRVFTHADLHMAAWSRTGARTLYLGGDGGLAVVRDPYRASVPSGSGKVPSDPSFVDCRRNKGIQGHLAYTIASTDAASPADGPWRVIAGCQDVCTPIRMDGGAGMAASTVYTPYATGDGLGVAIHPLDGSRMIAASYFESVNSLGGVGSDGRPTSQATTTVGHGGLFDTPIVPVPSDPTGNTVLSADATTVYRSTDFGLSWSPLPMNGVEAGFALRRVAVCPTNAQVMAVTGSLGAASMLGYATRDGGATWTRFGAFPTNGSAQPTGIWGLSISARDPQVMYATAVGFNRNASHLWRSADGGATWRALDGSPAAPNGYPFGVLASFLVESKVDPATLFAGTDFGLYLSRDSGATWARLGAGLPLVRSTDLWESSDGSKVRISTYGRGLWEVGRVEVSVSPAVRAVTAGRSAAFTAAVRNSANTAVSWSVLEPGGGSVSAAGLYTAPAALGTYHVRATSLADPTRYADATVTVVAPPSISSFTASPATVREGSASTLTATFANGTGAVTGLGPLGSGQSLSTGPLHDTRTFSLVVTNAAGDQAAATATVGVIKLPVITSFTAAKPIATAGFSTTLTPVFLYGAGTVTEIGPVTSGTAYGTGLLTQDKSWTLTVTNSLGDQATATCTVRVVAPPAITRFTASPQIVRWGGLSSLSVAFTGGATAYINGPIGQVSSGGTYTTPPIYQSTSYVLTVTNEAGDSASASVMVAVAMGGAPDPAPSAD